MPQETHTAAPTSTLAPSRTPAPTSTSVPTNKPKPTPTASPIPPTATPNYADGYETDVSAPSPIAVGETQTRNFYPLGDIDFVNVMVKSGRSYQVSTSELALGVDTFLEVDLNGDHWENDDYQAPGSGDFSSAICFSSPVNETALITVTNLAQLYSAARIYKLDIVEVPGLVLEQTTLDFGQVVSDSTNPASQDITVNGGSSLAWTAAADSAWIALNKIEGNVPSVLTVTVDIADLQPGAYEGEVEVFWGTLCSQKVTVTLQVDPSQGSGANPSFHARPIQVSHRKPALLPPNVPVNFTILVEVKVDQP